jgi:hypothetical protein
MHLCAALKNLANRFLIALRRAILGRRFKTVSLFVY